MHGKFETSRFPTVSMNFETTCSSEKNLECYSRTKLFFQIFLAFPCVFWFCRSTRTVGHDDDVNEILLSWDCFTNCCFLTGNLYRRNDLYTQFPLRENACGFQKFCCFDLLVSLVTKFTKRMSEKRSINLWGYLNCLSNHWQGDLWGWIEKCYNSIFFRRNHWRRKIPKVGYLSVEITYKIFDRLPRYYDYL